MKANNKHNIEYRNMTINENTVENIFHSDFYVEGMATTFNTPYPLMKIGDTVYYEQIDKDALRGADLSDVIFQYDHSGKILARTKNNTLSLENTSSGLLIRADLSKSNAAKEMYEEIKTGLVDKLSWAFSVEEESFNEITKTRTILKIKKVYDVSAVSYPANPNTSVLSRNLFGQKNARKINRLKEKIRRIKHGFNNAKEN